MFHFGVYKKGTRMTEQDIKQIIIDTLSEQNAFRDLSPLAIVSMSMDMLFEILRKAQEK